MAEKAVMWLVLACCVTLVTSQRINVSGLKGNGICKDNENRTRYILRSLAALKHSLKNCVVIVGNLQLAMEYTAAEQYINVSFPNLREITGFFVMYRVKGLDSVGQLFPNLARIRGTELLNNYALIIYDMIRLTEIGLYSLLKIDRGGVIVWEVPQACFVDTVDWRVIAPKSRHVIAHPDKKNHCNFRRTCDSNNGPAHCWNNKMPQLYVDGEYKMNCSDQCFGCSRTKPDDCFLCKYYTNRLQCVKECPKDRLILEDSKYCITVLECKNMGGWEFNKTCVFECPIKFVVKNNTLGHRTCDPCTGSCHQKCGDQKILTTAGIQAAERCVHINGSLEIHIRAIPDAMEELERLRNIEEVTDYILIYGSLTIQSLKFLSGLRRIGGRNLRSERYSFLLHDMEKLHELLPENVMKNLVVDKGSLQIYSNPNLCGSHIDKLRQRFPVTIDDEDIPKGSNGYGGVCEEVPVDIKTKDVTENTAHVLFPVNNVNLEYSVVYARIPPNTSRNFVPETCSNCEWHSVDVPVNSTTTYGFIKLTSLRPASVYAICVETHDPVHETLARSNIFNFTTLAGIPEPPFIIELVARSFDAVVITWLDHEDFRPWITYYKLEVILIEAHKKVLNNINFCKHIIDEEPISDYDHHALVMRPPPEYGKGCESMCGVLSTVTKGALVDEFFDVCNSIDFDCNIEEDSAVENSTFDNYIRTLYLKIEKRNPQEFKFSFQVAELAPYRDYTFKLRACTYNKCSRSARGVVRTFRSRNADIPEITSVAGYENGLVIIQWEHPKITNGPVLAYIIEVLPEMEPKMQLMPQSWCVLSSETLLTVQSSPASKYSVKVCSKTLASGISCSESEKVTAIKLNFWRWTGITFSILFFVASILFGCYLNKTNKDDRQRLLEADLVYMNESDPPITLLHSVPFYSVPLHNDEE